jgi:HSP20 family protein
MERLLRRLSEQYEETAETWEFDRPFGDLTLGTEIPADVVEQDDSYVVTVDLPGFERDDVDIEVTDHTLHVDAQRETTVDEDGDRYLRRERQETSAHRALRLPEEVQPGDVTAQMHNGVLTVTLPRSAVEEAHRIEIE